MRGEQPQADKFQSKGWARLAVSAAIASLMLTACGGGGESATVESGSDMQAMGAAKAGSRKASERTRKAPRAATSAPTTNEDAYRLLSQASFGPTQAEVSRVAAMGVQGWLDEQFAMPAREGHYVRYQQEDALAKQISATANAGAEGVLASFYTQALTAPDQLRQRVAYALSQIFVVSTSDLAAANSAVVASFMDLLNRNAFGNYRTLLEEVSKHPAMGMYLSHRGNRKEDPKVGRVPDENYAREIMQLFSIGLIKLKADGTPALDTNGNLVETYGPDDIAGLAKVFTGWAFGGPDTSDQRFYSNPSYLDPNRFAIPMQTYPQFHSITEKRFLGTVIPAQSTADGPASLKTALDRLFNDKNVGPFISRQLIQRLVKSNPSTGYVWRVAAAFEDNGQGVRGDLSAVVRAILLDNEARDPVRVTWEGEGKVREPVLRVTSLLRAMSATSDSGRWLMTVTDDPGLALGQTPMRSPSVFNFYKPGYIAPGSFTGAQGMTMPELQITTETSVAGYVNFMSMAVSKGIGRWSTGVALPRPDIQLNLSQELALADNAGAMVDSVLAKLLGPAGAPALKSEIVEAVNSVVIPTLNKNATNQRAIDSAKRNRVNIALLLTLAAHENIVQR